MAVRGKNINLFLMDGTVNGRIKCTLSNWTGVAYKIPRTELEKCKEREDLKQSGVYFLFGTSESTGESVVYIGQAGIRKNGEGLLFRLQEHKRDSGKDYWNEAVLFTTSNNSFGPTEISYLENRFCKMAKEASRYEVKNSNDPTPGNVTEEKQSELEEFIDNAKVIIGALGYKVLEGLIETDNNGVNATKSENEILYLKRKITRENMTVEARCKQIAEGFVVLRGSKVALTDSGAIPEAIKLRRQKAEIEPNGLLLKDVLFSSPSYAAAFVIGGSANGMTEWKTVEGQTLKDLEESRVN